MNQAPSLLTPHHIAIKTDAVETLARFYADVLGLPHLKTWESEDGAVRSIWLLCGTMIVMFERAPSGIRSEDAGLHLLAFQIPTTERTRWKTYLGEHNVKITGETEYSLYFEDPDGNRLALSHYRS